MVDYLRRVQRKRDVLSASIETMTVLTRLENGCYFGLNEAASRVWEWLAQPCSVDRLSVELSQAFNVSAETAAIDASRLFDELMAEGFIEITNNELPTASGIQMKPIERRPYSGLCLERGLLKNAASGNSGNLDGGLTTSGGPGGLS